MKNQLKQLFTPLNLAILLLVFFCGSLVGTYKFFPFKQIRYLKNLTDFSDQKKSSIQKRPSVRKKPRATLFDYFSPKSDVVMIGDSLTEHVIWSEIFTQKRIANRGVGGDKGTNILARMDTILNVKPSKALIMFGINDFYTDIPVENIFSNYKKIVTILRNQGVEVLIQSTLECSLPLNTEDKNPRRLKCVDILENIRRLNKLLEQYADDRGLSFININANLSSEEKGLLHKYSYDGVHLLGEGYLVWANQIKSYVE